jgi:hypothetical protein
MTRILRLEETSSHAGEPTTIYQVVGLPAGHEAFIRRIDSKWKVLRMKNGVRQSWDEGFETLEDAFAIVRAEYETDPQL